MLIAAAICARLENRSSLRSGGQRRSKRRAKSAPGKSTLLFAAEASAFFQIRSGRDRLLVIRQLRRRPRHDRHSSAAEPLSPTATLPGSSVNTSFAMLHRASLRSQVIGLRHSWIARRKRVGREISHDRVSILHCFQQQWRIRVGRGRHRRSSQRSHNCISREKRAFSLRLIKTRSPLSLPAKAFGHRRCDSAIARFTDQSR